MKVSFRVKHLKSMCEILAGWSDDPTKTYRFPEIGTSNSGHGLDSLERNGFLTRSRAPGEHWFEYKITELGIRTAKTIRSLGI